MQLHSKKYCSLLICRGGPLLPPGFNFLLAFHHSLGMAAGEQGQGKHQCPACSPGFDFGCLGHTGFNFSPAFKKAKNFSTWETRQRPYVLDIVSFPDLLKVCRQASEDGGARCAAGEEHLLGIARVLHGFEQFSIKLIQLQGSSYSSRETRLLWSPWVCRNCPRSCSHWHGEF